MEMTTEVTYVKNRVDNITQNLKTMTSSLNEIKKWVSSVENKVDKVSYENVTMDDVLRCRSKVEELREKLFEAQKNERTILEMVQHKCEHKTKKWSRGGNHCYGDEDRDLYCVECEKIFY